MLLRMKTIFFASVFIACQAHGQTEEVVSVRLRSGTIAGLLMHQEGAKDFKYGIALFPGHPGIMKLRRDEDGQAQYELRGNYLVRSRRHWLDADTLVAVIDAPSDEWTSFTQHYRSTAPYGEAVKSLIGEIGRRYAVDDWTFVGTSEGSNRAQRPGPGGRRLDGAERRASLRASRRRPVRVHHAFTAHGFVGVERAVVLAMRQWVKTGDLPADVSAGGP